MFIKVVSHGEIQTWTVEVSEYQRRKYFPKSYADMNDIFQEHSNYYVPVSAPCLMEDYDWSKIGEDFFCCVTILLIRKRFVDEYQSVLLNEASVFVMNNEGKTIDRLQA